MAKKKGVAGGFKEFFQYSSITTPDATHASYCLAAEILTVRHASECGTSLPPYFWRKDVECNEKYKQQYTKNIECMRKLMKHVPPHFVIQCVTYTRQIKYSDYGYITAVIKNKWETWNKRLATRITGIIQEQVRKDAISEEQTIFAAENADVAEVTIAAGRKKKVRL